VKRLGISLLATVAFLGVLVLHTPRAQAELNVGLVAAWPDLNGTWEEPNWEVLEQTGVNRVRFQFDWFTEIQEGGWVPSYDRYVEKAALHGITLVAVLYGRANNSPQIPVQPERSEWLNQFVREAVTRYGQSGTFWEGFSKKHPATPIHPITVWEVWNEPNRPVNNPGEVVNPTAYRELLTAASNTIHAAANERQGSNEATVLFGGLNQIAPTAAKEGEFSEPIAYFNAVAKGFGLTPYFSGLAIHPYAFGRKGTMTVAGREQEFQTKVTEARTALSKLCAECATKESLWITELGWPLAKIESPPNEHEQAMLLALSFNWLREKSNAFNIPLALWYD
jgi:hypothetical protein